MVASQSIVLRAAERLSHLEATRLANLASGSSARTIVIDVSRCLEATTPALARLVLLRREMLQRGSDVRIAGLRGQPAKLIEVHRLENVLLQISEFPADFAPTSARPARTARVEYAKPCHADNAGAFCLQ